MNAPGQTLRAGQPVLRNGVIVDDSFAEAFAMRAVRILITAHNPTWALHAANAATGFATSVIACGCEAGIERLLSPDETPDGRPGVAILIMSMSSRELTQQIERRVGQCVLTCPTTAVYAGLAAGDALACPAVRRLPGGVETTLVPLGKNLRFFGDGWQISKLIDGQRYWRVPVMDGEFVAQESLPMVKAVGGGNLLLMCADTDAALATAEAAADAMRRVPGVILPFPGGVVRSGSKVGSKYPALMASTNDAFCPTLKGLVRHSEINEGVRCVMEIVIDGLSEADVGRAMTAGMRAALARGRAGGLLRIAAGNYGGKLGPFHFHLQALLPDAVDAAASAADSAAANPAAGSAEPPQGSPPEAGQKARCGPAPSAEETRR